MPAKHSPKDIELIGKLIKQGLTNNEIAKTLGWTLAATQIQARRRFGGNANYRKRITKHSHLRVPVMKYFMTHTAKETRDKFNLTLSEFKSLCTIAYRSPELVHLRKDTRRRDWWTLNEDVFLLRHAGLQSREWIAQKLGRGNSRVIKERLNRLGVSSRTLNGMTLSQYRKAFQSEPSSLLETTAGPGRNGAPTHFKIVPWVIIVDEMKAKRIVVKGPVKRTFDTLGLFQAWIHGKDPLKSLNKALRGSLRAPKTIPWFCR